MLAYHSDPAIKTAILAQLQGHYDADEIVKGQYWDNGKGCAIACTIHSANHGEYETRFGIPRVLAHLEDRIFEGLPNAEAKEWPMRFMGAIKPGVDLAGVWPKFAAWLLVDPEQGVIRHAKTEAQKAIILEIAGLYARDERSPAIWKEVRERAWRVRSESWAYAYDADAAYADAAAAAYAADAAYAAAAYAAADAAAAYAAAAAAAGAAATAAAASARRAGEKARAEKYTAMAGKLIALLEAA